LTWRVLHHCLAVLLNSAAYPMSLQRRSSLPQAWIKDHCAGAIGHAAGESFAESFLGTVAFLHDHL